MGRHGEDEDGPFRGRRVTRSAGIEPACHRVDKPVVPFERFVHRCCRAEYSIQDGSDERVGYSLGVDAGLNLTDDIPFRNRSCTAWCARPVSCL